MENLTIEKLENDFLAELKKGGVDLSPNAVCRINSNVIYLGIAATSYYKDKGFKAEFASEVELYSFDPTYGRQQTEINFGSSGCFTPENKGSYWRTIHAASILIHWNVVCEIVNSYCKMYVDLQKANFNSKIND